MKRIVLYTLALLMILAGCKKNLDLAPKDTISDATFWKTPADFKLAANALYGSLEGFNFGDTEADIAYTSGNSISQGTYLPTETSDSWTNAYATIRQCNNVIAKGDAFVNDTEIKKYVAEARFFKAYNMWLLFRLYGGIPLINEVLGTNENEKLFAPRSTFDETANAILADLAAAATDLPEKAGLDAADVGRITKGAANGLRARVALYTGTWKKTRGESGADAFLDIAIAAANSVIANGYSLYTGSGADSYRQLFIEPGDDCSETILDRRYQRDISGQSYPFSLDRGGYVPTKKLADMYLCTDGRPIDNSPLFQGYGNRLAEYQNRDPRMTMTMYIPGTLSTRVFFPTTPVANWPFYPQRVASTGYIIYKYISQDVASNSQSENGNSHSYDMHIIRYAEILLIYAEASYEKNGSISNEDLEKSINVLRNRVNMPRLTNAFVTANNLDMRTEIRRERTIELALEGFRYDDLRRWKTAEVELKQDIKGIKIVGTDWANPIIVAGADRNVYASAAYQARTDANGFILVEKSADRFFDPAKHYLRPLPTKEIQLYGGILKQNPGW